MPQGRLLAPDAFGRREREPAANTAPQSSSTAQGEDLSGPDFRALKGYTYSPMCSIRRDSVHVSRQNLWNHQS